MTRPDVGVYLTPDPEHRASTKVYPGPEAYAYAGGRPLVYVDRDGRKLSFAFNETLAFGPAGTVVNTPRGAATLGPVATGLLIRTTYGFTFGFATGVNATSPCKTCDDCSFEFDANADVDIQSWVMSGVGANAGGADPSVLNWRGAKERS